MGRNVAPGTAGNGLGVDVAPGAAGDGDGDLEPPAPAFCRAGVDVGTLPEPETGVTAGPAGLVAAAVAAGVAAAVVEYGVGMVAAGLVGYGVDEAVGEGEAPDVVRGVRAYGEGIGLGDEGMGNVVAAGVSCGAGGKWREGPGTSLAWLAGGVDGLLVGAGLAAGLLGAAPEGLLAGEVPEGQRPQLAAQ